MREKFTCVYDSMPRQLPDSKTLILKVIKTFQTEANRNKPIAGFSNPLKRAALTLGLSRKCIDRVKKSDSAESTTKERKIAKRKYECNIFSFSAE